MAIGGSMAGHIFDITGTYKFAFIGGFAFNLVHLVIVSGLFIRLRNRGANLQTA